MIFVLISIIVPTVIFFGLPRVLELLQGKKPGERLLLLTACGIFFISWYLPSPLIEGRDTSFTTHFVGGGFFTALLWLYLCRYFNVRFWGWYSLAGLYFLVCGLGVANELFEFVVYELELTSLLEPSDTWWDLVANSTGALLMWGILNMYVYNKSRQR